MKYPSAIFDTHEATGFASVIPYHQKKYPHKFTLLLNDEQQAKVNNKKNRQEFIRKLIDKA